MEGSGIGQFIPLRPQQKKVKEHKAMVENLKRGDKVITSGGITGTIERIIDNDKVEVEISENVKVEIVKATGIQGLINSTEVKK
jgi:preprotein translocase subunit YajC